MMARKKEPDGFGFNSKKQTKNKTTDGEMEAETK